MDWQDERVLLSGYVAIDSRGGNPVVRVLLCFVATDSRLCWPMVVN